MADDDLTRLYDFTANTTIQSSQVDGEFNQLITGHNGKVSRTGVNTISGANTFSGNNTHSGTNTFSHATTPILTDIIVERTAATGVTIDSVVHKDGFIRVPAGAGYTPATNGDFGYDSTSHTYDVYVNGAAKFLIHDGNLSTSTAALAGSSGASLVLLNAQAASASATIDFTGYLTSTYDEYVLEMDNVIFATDDISLQLRVGNAGVFDAGATNYNYAGYVLSSGLAGNENSDGTTFILCTGSSANTVRPGNAAGESLSGEIRIYGPSGTVNYKPIKIQTAYLNAISGRPTQWDGVGAWKGGVTAITDVRLLSSSGNITSGNFRLYGVKKS